MAKAVADINNRNEKQGGFASDDSEITGFSHMHDSGTGGVSQSLIANNHNLHAISHHHWEIFPSSHKLDALGILSITASSARQTEHRRESMALFKPTQDTLLSA